MQEIYNISGKDDYCISYSTQTPLPPPAWYMTNIQGLGHFTRSHFTYVLLTLDTNRKFKVYRIEQSNPHPENGRTGVVSGWLS